ncbi:peptide-methionine (S)-S-oxide reductase [Weissella muntiaci]|uniref:Peptide methionine sulfoxide reductase MsrA n=1 Tax=Weissella muntiaci TaxID=2508881 RepID=A0A6C2C2P8_9LACO|nr:peptide-methionine (S)-S-oxide reductase MsrA [Weissella muntiaci]TYC48062.1 peptide-methionine (S)-S-oxide reductase [Weissella muntiaci]
MTEEHAIFAGGCFWCTVEPFASKPGIISIVSGYTGGHIADPTYDQVIGQYSGHVEAVEITFDNQQISYSELLTIYWQIIDPTDANGQFADRGESYRPVIFVNGQEQRRLAEASKADVIASKKYHRPIIVEIRDNQPFWPAEDYHQDFYRKNPRRYRAMERSRAYLRFMQNIKNHFSK